MCALTGLKVISDFWGKEPPAQLLETKVNLISSN